MKSSIDKLCPNCGLCCDSTLFADVKLRESDDAKRLAQLGLVLTRKGVGKFGFSQPCKCFDGKYCNIYHNRPVQCRAFECGLLKKLADGQISLSKALKTISEAKTLANRVRGLLRAFGQHPEEKPMAHCYSEAMTGPIDLSGDAGNAKRQGSHRRLMEAFGDLVSVLERNFLQ